MDKVSVFLDHLKKEKRFSLHTLRNYSSDLEQLKAFIESEYDCDELNKVQKEWVRSWVVSMMKQGLAPRTIHRKISSFRTYAKFARRNGFMSNDPVEGVVLPKLNKRLPNVLPEHNVEDLFSDELFDDNWMGSRDKLLMGLLYDTGIRRSELIALKKSDVDISRSTLKVFGKGGKERLIPLLESTTKLIANHIESREFQSDSLIITDKGNELNPSFVYRKVNYYLSKVSTLQKCSPHVLRHTFATHMLNNGAELAAVKDLLGHASLSSTQVYTHHTTAKLKEFHQSSPLDRR